MDFESFDSQLFTWESWAQEGPLSMQFSNVELKVPVGEFPVGTKFPHALLLGDQSILILIDEKEEVYAFNLNLSVGDKVDTSKLMEHNHEDSCDCGHDH
jgi:hypothetical protein